MCELLTITSAVVDHRMLMFLVGEVDASVSEQLDRMVVAAVDAHPHVALDLTDVTFIDSAGLQSLVLGYRHAQLRGTKFCVSAMSSRVRRILELTDLLPVLVLPPEPVASRRTLVSTPGPVIV